MAITPKEVTLQDVFSNTKYYVDFYQREYKWNDKQEYKPISSLIEDIFFRFDLNYKSSDPVTQDTVDKYSFYYLNSYMINRVDGKTYIVDGQQRLTTLTIISIMLCKIASELDANSGIIKYLEGKICSNDMLGNYTFWMGFDDRELALSNIMNKSVQEIKELDKTDATISQKNIYEAAPIVYHLLKERLNNLHVFGLFMLYFYSRITMVQLDVIEAKDVAMTFEVINDRGVPLRAYEILKGKLVGSLDKADQSTYADKWDKCINPLMDMDGKTDETDDFFEWYFQSKYANNYNEHKALGKQYHKSIFVEPFAKRIGFKDVNDRTHISKIKKFIDEDLEFFSKLYVRMHENKRSEDKGVYFWFCYANGQNTSIHNLMLSAISYNDPKLNEKYELVSKEFDRLYTVLMLTNSYDSSGFVPQMADLALKIRNADSLELISNSFRETIKTVIKNKKNKENVDDIFASNLYENAGYSLGNGFLRYFFGRIDHYLADEMSLPTVTYHGLIRQTQGNTIYHIEHILGRNEENKSWFESEDEFEDQRNQLAGLTLLKGPDNQSSGNEKYADKLSTYMAVGSIWVKTLCEDFSHSNTGLKLFCEKHDIEFKTYEKYDKDALKDRFAILMKLIKLIWGD